MKRGKVAEISSGQRKPQGGGGIWARLGKMGFEAEWRGCLW